MVRYHCGHKNLFSMFTCLRFTSHRFHGKDWNLELLLPGPAAMDSSIGDQVGKWVQMTLLLVD